MNATHRSGEMVAVSASLKRAAVALPITIILCFCALKITPNGPFSANPAVEPDILPRIRQAFDASASAAKQLLGYAWGIVRGDLGPSMRLAQYSVSELIVETIGWTLMLIAIALALAAGLAWCMAVLDRRIGGAISIALDTALAAVAATPAIVIVWSLAFGIGMLGPEYGGFLVAFVLPPVAVGLPVAVAHHFLRRHFEATGRDPVTAATQGIAACLPLLLLMVPLVEQAFQRPGIGLLLMLSARGGDVTIAAGFALCFAAIAVTLDVVSTLLIGRVVKTGFVDTKAGHLFRPTMAPSVKWRSAVGLMLLGLIGGLLLTAAVSGRGADDIEFDELGLPPSLGHLLGTDDLGRDHLAAVAASVETSMGAALLAGLVATGLGIGWASAIRGLHGTGRSLLKMLTDGLAVLPWPCLALCFAAAGLQPLAVLILAVNTAPVIARVATDRTDGKGAGARRNPMAAMLAVAALAVAYAVIANIGFELAEIGPMVPAHTIGNFLYLNVSELPQGIGWAAFLVVIAVPMFAVAGLAHLSGVTAYRPQPAEDPYARVF